MRRFLVAVLAAPFLVLPVAAPASAACVGVASDFNGDGYGDLAVGSPQRYEPIYAGPWHGALHVAYGSAAGMGKGSASVTLTGASPGMGDGRLRGSSARLGESLASGDFDGDCFADLALSSASGSSFVILYGGLSGITTSRSVILDRTTIQPDGQYGSGLSYDLAAGDFNGDGFDDVAAGAPWTDGNSGAFGVLYGSAFGISGAGSQWITQDSPDVPGGAEPDDLLGWVLAAGDFDGDGKADLAAGAPGEALGGRPDAGGVLVFPGTAAGLATAGSTWWDQDSAGVPGEAEGQDNFGYTVAAGDTDGDRRAELVVGSPQESIGAESAAGMINLFRGTAAGLVPGLSFSQDTANVPGTAESGDYFGSALAFADLNRDGRGDLAVGIRGESTGTVGEAGAITLLYSGASGPSATGSEYLDQNSAGVPGSNEASDLFGWSLSRVPNAYGGDALAVGAPDEDVSFTSEGAVTILPSAAKGTSRSEGHFLSGADFPGGAAKESNFGHGLP